MAALGLNVFAKAETVVFQRRDQTKGGHGGPPLQYVPNGLLDLCAVVPMSEKLVAKVDA